LPLRQFNLHLLELVQEILMVSDSSVVEKGNSLFVVHVRMGMVFGYGFKAFSFIVLKV
jgi:hypothetical protein